MPDLKDSDLKEKVAIVTGGAGGIGSAIAREYARAGARVVIASRNLDNLKALAGRIVSAGGTALAIAADVTDENQVDSLVEQTVSEFGRLDIMVNNAGGALHIKKALDLSADEWRDGIALNLNSVFFGSVAAARVMMTQSGGRIINISSVAGIKHTPSMAHYGAAKAGVISLTRTLAASWAKDSITVNCIAPGLTATPGIQKSRMLPKNTDKNGDPLPPLQFPPEPEHCAHLAVFLASDAAERITGETIPLRAQVEFDR